MGNANQPVELFFPGPNISLIGSLIELRSDGASVQVAPLQIPVEQIPERVALLMGVPSGEMILQTPAIVAGYSQSALALTFTGAGKLVQRRSSRRLTCSLAVRYRAVRDGRAHGSWKSAMAEDASEGGLALIIEGHVQFPPMVELQLVLPISGGWTDPDLPHGTDESLVRGDEPGIMVRFTGRARHGRFKPNGTTSVGVKFSAVHPSSRLRLLQYLETITAEEQGEVREAA